MPGTTTRPVAFASRSVPPVTLAGQFHLPAVVPTPLPGVVLCHPQPLVADMEDPLLRHLAFALAGAGLAALRFDFRGVAPSQGDTTDGRLEPLDVAGAVSWLLQQPEVDARWLALVGHAFGAIPALAYAAVDARIGAVVAISPPHFRLAPALISDLPQARLVITGDDDEVSPRYKLDPWLARWPGPSRLAVVRNATHLMRGREAAAAEIIVPFLAHWAQGIR